MVVGSRASHGTDVVWRVGVVMDEYAAGLRTGPTEPRMAPGTSTVRYNNNPSPFELSLLCCTIKFVRPSGRQNGIGIKCVAPLPPTWFNHPTVSPVDSCPRRDFSLPESRIDPPVTSALQTQNVSRSPPTSSSCMSAQEMIKHCFVP